MASAAPKLGRKSDDGFILVAVLWILGGLAVLAAIYALYVVNAATSLEVNNDRIQANASVSAALELTAYYLGAVKPQERPTSGTFSFQRWRVECRGRLPDRSGQNRSQCGAAAVIGGLVQSARRVVRRGE